MVQVVLCCASEHLQRGEGAQGIRTSETDEKFGLKGENIFLAEGRFGEFCDYVTFWPVAAADRG